MSDPNEKRILLVEDDNFLADLLVLRFKKENFLFELAKDGEESLEKARSLKPDLIVLDLVLPGISGYEVLTQLKADKELASVPVLILSNLGQKDEIERGLRLGAVDFIVKAAFDLDQIVDKIKKLLKVE